MLPSLNGIPVTSTSEPLVINNLKKNVDDPPVISSRVISIEVGLYPLFHPPIGVKSTRLVNKNPGIHLSVDQEESKNGVQ